MKAFLMTFGTTITLLNLGSLSADLISYGQGFHAFYLSVDAVALALGLASLGAGLLVRQ